MAFFNIGDKVTVRSDILEGLDYAMEDQREYWVVVHDMEAYKGKVLTIKQAFESGYRCEECDEWRWADNMFEEYIHRNDVSAYVEFEPASGAEILSFVCGM